MPLSQKVGCLLLLCWLAGAVDAQAQTQTTETLPLSRHSLKAGCGVAPIHVFGQVFGDMMDGFFSIVTRWEKTKQTYSVVALTSEYNYELSRKWQVGLTGTYVGWRSNYVYRGREDDPEPVYEERKVRSRAFGIMPRIAFKWVNRERYQLYTSYAMGFNLSQAKESVTGMTGEKRHWSTAAFQLNLIGVNYFGKGRVGGFMETGFGWAGLFNSGVIVRL